MYPLGNRASPGRKCDSTLIGQMGAAVTKPEHDGEHDTGGHLYPVPPAGLNATMDDLKPWFRRPWVWIVGGVLATAFIAGAVWSISTIVPSSFDLHGQLALKRLLSGSDGQGGCHGLRAYSDLGPGRQVTVYDQNGALIATGSLGQGMYSGNEWCVFPIEVPGVPDGRGSYTVAVGEDRGKLTYSQDQAKNGQVSMTLGAK